MEKTGRYSKVIKDSEPSTLRDTGIIPSSVDKWIIDQFQKTARGEWVVRELKKKADQDWIEEKFRSLRREAEDTKSIIKEHKGKLSKAPKREEMNEVKMTVTGWSDWFRRLVIGFIILLVGTGGVAMWQYSALNSKVEMTYESINKIVEMVNEMKESQEKSDKKFNILQQIIKEEYRLKLEEREKLLDTGD